MLTPGPIGVFDSGFGGLTILKELKERLPQYDYLYLGDNARAPYGTRSFESVYEYTLEAVNFLFSRGCNLVILACNTASAKALRSIQQKDLPSIDPDKRVLGVIRPTTEIIGNLTKSKTIGILGTSGTVQSLSYPIEIKRFFPNLTVFQEACPMWVPLIENNEFNTEGADFFFKKNITQLLSKSTSIDTLVLACTHYPIILEKLKKITPESIKILSQGSIVANGLENYLQRHRNMENNCSKNHTIEFLTTDSPISFDEKGSLFFGQKIHSKQIDIQAKF